MAHTNMTEAMSHTQHDNTSHMLKINITQQERMANKHNNSPCARQKTQECMAQEQITPMICSQ